MLLATTVDTSNVKYAHISKLPYYPSRAYKHQ
jgi:hypothetical protein